MKLYAWQKQNTNAAFARIQSVRLKGETTLYGQKMLFLLIVSKSSDARRFSAETYVNSMSHRNCKNYTYIFCIEH